MVGFIDAHRDAHGVEPICNVLPIAPSTYMITLRSGPIRPGCRIGHVGTRRCARRFFGSSKRTGESMASGRFGGSWAARVLMSPDALWHG